MNSPHLASIASVDKSRSLPDRRFCRGERNPRLGVRPESGAFGAAERVGAPRRWPLLTGLAAKLRVHEARSREACGSPEVISKRRHRSTSASSLTQGASRGFP
jgi:hypothetical protein